MVSRTERAAAALIQASTSTKKAGTEVRALISSAAALIRIASRLPDRHATTAQTTETTPSRALSTSTAIGGPSCPSGVGTKRKGMLMIPRKAEIASPARTWLVVRVVPDVEVDM